MTTWVTPAQIRLPVITLKRLSMFLSGCGGAQLLFVIDTDCCRQTGLVMTEEAYLPWDTVRGVHRSVRDRVKRL